MIIGINASFLRKPDTGIGQVTANFLRKLAELKVKSEKLKSKDLKFILYLEEDFDLDLPENFEKRVFLPFFHKRDDLIRRVIWERYLLPKKIKEDKCDIFFSMYQSSTILQATSHKPQAKHIMLVHDTVWKIFPQYLNNSRKKIYSRLMGKAIKKADKIMTISENSKKDVMKYFGIPAKTIKVNYIDCDEVFKKEISNFKFQISNYYIFYVGGFEARKNVGTLIEAYGKLSKKYEHISNFPDLVLAGKFQSHLVPLVSDIPNKINQVCQKYNLPEEKIKQLGFVKQKNLPALYKNAQLFCYPSLYEGFGLPVLEAMNCSCPVVAGNNSSIPEVCSEDSAMLINTEDADETAEAMHDLLVDRELAREKIEAAQEEAKGFSWDNFVEGFWEIVNSN